MAKSLDLTNEEMRFAMEVVASANGEVTCAVQVAEECSELIKECTKFLRLRGVGSPVDKDKYNCEINKEHLAEEIADVILTVSELEYELDLESLVKDYLTFKLIRRLEGLYAETKDIVFAEARNRVLAKIILPEGDD